jgi:hypothetical protein
MVIIKKQVYITQLNNNNNTHQFTENKKIQIEMTAFWDTASSSLFEVDRCFRSAHFLQNEGHLLSW